MIYSNNEEVYDVAAFCYNKLKLTRNVSIEVKPLEVDGYCYENSFVEISDTLKGIEFYTTICHELVHCAQYERCGNANEEEAYRLEKELYESWREVC